MSKKIRIGSRGSDLALWQAHFFQDQMKEIGIDSEIIIIKTKGDRIQHLSFDKMEGKGFFTKEIEEALLQKRVDVAIHSHKDLETQSPPGLQVAGVSYREDPSDLLLIRKENVDRSMPLHFTQGAIIGTSSARRKGQITSLRPDVSIKDIRGNVPTRINKLRSGDFDAILIAFAGVHRLELDLSDLHVEKLDPKLFIPAPAQGVLAFQCREEDEETASIIRKIHNQEVHDRISIERGILSGFGGGCQIPIGVYAERSNDRFDVRVSYATSWEDFNPRVRFQASNLNDALAKFEGLKTKKMPASVFVSRELKQDSTLLRASRELVFDLHQKSMIQVDPVPFSVTAADFDWVFFSSSNAVRSFFEQCNIDDWRNVKFACVGEGTAQALSKKAGVISFVGEGSDTEEIAKTFAERIGDQKVLFPASDRSLKSIQKQLSKTQVEDIVCYTTRSAGEKLHAFDAHIFTSPSNVEAFLSAGNALTSKDKVIAIGPSTATALRKHKVKCLVADIPDEAELLALLAS